MPNSVNVKLSYSFWDFLPLNDLKKCIAEAEQRAAEENIYKIWLQVEYTRGYYNDIEMEVCLMGTRFETEEEKKIREENEQRRFKLNKDQRYEQYLRYKEEFEK